MRVKYIERNISLAYRQECINFLLVIKPSVAIEKESSVILGDVAFGDILWLMQGLKVAGELIYQSTLKKLKSKGKKRLT